MIWFGFGTHGNHSGQSSASSDENQGIPVRIIRFGYRRVRIIGNAIFTSVDDWQYSFVLPIIYLGQKAFHLTLEILKVYESTLC